MTIAKDINTEKDVDMTVVEDVNTVKDASMTAVIDADMTTLTSIRHSLARLLVVSLAEVG